MQSEVSKEYIGSLIAIIKVNYSYAYKDATAGTFAAMIETWHTLLKPYPRKVVDAAFKATLYRCKFPPTLADIAEQVNAIAKIRNKSDSELWAELETAVSSAADIFPRTRYTAVTADGRTQGDHARDEVLALWERLDERLKAFCGGFSRFANMAGLETLEYVKAEFNKAMPKIEETTRLKRELPQALLETASIKFLEGERGNEKL